MKGSDYQQICPYTWHSSGDEMAVNYTYHPKESRTQYRQASPVCHQHSFALEYEL